jgi:hypothetical protein
LGPDRRAIKGTSEGKLVHYVLHLAAVTRSSKYVVTVSPAGDDRETVANRFCSNERSVWRWNDGSGSKIRKWVHCVDGPASWHTPDTPG